MKTKELLKIEAKIEATENLVQWISDSEQLSDNEKQEAILKQMRQLNSLIATANKTTEKLGFWARKFSPARKLQITK